MNIRRSFIVVSGAAMLFGATTAPLLAGAEQPTLGTTTTTTSVGGEFVVPPGYTFLTDDTNRITVAVPATWADHVTAPTTVDSTLVPSIGAATDLDVWESSFDAPGVLYSAFPFTADPQPLLDRFDASGGCTATTVVPYTDGVFSGSWSQSTGCGTTDQSAWHVIVSSPADRSFTAVVAVQLTGPQDQEAFDVVLQTFNVTPSATWPATGSAPRPTTTPAPTTAPIVSTAPSTTAPSSTAPSTTTPPSTTTAPSTTTPASPTTAPTTTAFPAVGVRLVDATNFLTVTVPADWIDQDLDPSTRDDGGDRPSIVASPDLAQYYDSFAGSGVYLLALPATTEPADLLARHNFPNRCTDGGVTVVDDARFSGLRQTWLNCDESAAEVVNIAARSADNSFTMFLQVRQAAPADEVLNQIVATAGAVPGEVYPKASPAAPLTPTGPVPPELLVAPDIAVTVVADNQGRLSVAVPSTWTDTDNFPSMNDDASDRPTVRAAPALDEFLDEWGAPGVQVVAYPFTADPSTLLRNLAFADQCTDAGVQSLSDGTFTGLMQSWTECGDTTARDVQLALSPADQSVTVYIEMQLSDEDNTPLQAVLSSLQVG